MGRRSRKANPRSPEALFNQLVISSTAQDLAVGNINTITATPEPDAYALVGFGLLALSIPSLRRKSARAAFKK